MTWGEDRENDTGQGHAGQVQGARARFKDRSSYVPGARSMVFIASIAPTIYSLKCPKE